MTDQPILLPHNELYLDTCFSADGALLMVASHTANSDTKPLAIVWDTTTWNELTRIQNSKVVMHPSGQLVTDLTIECPQYSPDGTLLAGISVDDGEGEEEEEEEYTEPVWYVSVVHVETGEVLHKLMKEADDREILRVCA
jgi:hypothetical protein